MMKSLLIAGMGGFVGTAFRFAISRYIQIHTPTVFPWGTFIVNILGSLLIGFIFGLTERGDWLSPEFRIFLTVGICGGFTTFSALTDDAFLLLQSREWLRFITYASLSFTLGLVAVYIGRMTTKLV
ncbi:putative fluoride ion transporter CrcB [Prolixibacter bellariivorans]|uniref:Fluoride-specific ion channel FluC n=1 Tax=Prolixibacter bellariivorans TaxID=314319 RepID=A0A5M4AV73_9BACT|nr:fluoride efflux transporter CrcB [Prolixibacter bellariivorans]GET31508.1 putative fluoride ion transporter CrcB [Prolixibacter bellariivorans]